MGSASPDDRAGRTTDRATLHARLEAMPRFRLGHLPTPLERLDRLSDVLAVPSMAADRIVVDDGFIGPGYGRPDDRTFEAIDLFATTEGILLDPVYTGKAAAGLLDACRTRRFEPGALVLFVHTGGQVANFAYRAEFERRHR